MSKKGPSPELLRQVRAEVEDHLSAMEQILLVLDQEPANVEQLSELYRRLHTMKGIAGLLGIPQLVEIAHETESKIESIRKEQRAISSEELDSFFAARDSLMLALSRPAQQEAEKKPDTESPQTPSKDSEEEESEETRFVLFRLESGLFALPMDSVHEVSPLLPSRKFPFSPEYFKGVLNLRGQLLPLIDLSSLLELNSSDGERNRILFVELGDELVGCLVDRVAGVSSLPGWEASAQALQHFGMTGIEAVSSHHGELVAVLNPGRLLSA